MKNAVGYSTHAVAGNDPGSRTGLYRQIGYYDRFVKSGAYAAQDVPFHFGLPTHQLHGKRWGVIGLGNIGREVARLAEAFGCTVAYTSTSGQIREERYPALPLRELLAWADVVTVLCWAQTLLKTRFDRETSRMLAATNYLEGTRSRRLPSPNSERGRRRPHGKQWPSACYSPECCVAA